VSAASAAADSAAGPASAAQSIAESSAAEGESAKASDAAPDTGAPAKADKGAADKPAGKDTKAPPEGEAGAGSEAARGAPGAPVKLHMPEAPTGPSPATTRRIQGVKARAGGKAAAHGALPAGDAQVGDARKAVDEPDAEANAKAQAALIAQVQAGPSAEIVQLCERIREVIKNKRPPDEDALAKAEPESAAMNAGSELNSTIDSETKKAQDNYGAVTNGPLPAGAPAKGADLAPQPDVPGTPPINAQAATPDAVPPGNVSLDKDAADSKKKAQDAGMDTPAAQLVQSGPVAEARDAQGELDKAAKEDPAKVLAAQKDTLKRAEGDMAALQAQALAALTTSRNSTSKGNASRQNAMVGSEESMRTNAGAEAKKTFDDAKNQVETLLKPLASTAMADWEAAKDVLATNFKNDLAIVKRRVDERHSGVGGWFVGVWDAVTGLPDWATEAYDKAEKAFGDGVIAKLTEISAHVNSVIAACDLIIKNARERIAKIFADLPESLRGWATQEQAKFDGQLDQLHKDVIAARDNFNKDLSDRASQAVDEVRTEIAELRKKAGGLVGRIVNAINRFIEDPVKFIIEGLLELLGIPPASFWAVVAKIKQVVKDIADDPMKFANNLLSGLAKGFGQFFDNILSHLLKGFIGWLTGGLGDVGVQLPKDASLKSIITFFLQLMGITWPRIRKILAKHVGETNVALLEKVWSLVSLLLEKGPEGIYEMIKDKLDPQSLVDQVVQLAVDFMISAVIKAVTPRIIGLFNPAGAILQALEAIYRVLKWIFENAARIFTLIETVVNGVRDILAGSIGGFANAVEKALAMLIAPVIGFIADYLGFGDLPNKIAKKIASFQEMVLGLIEKALVWLIEKGKALLAAVGIGKKDDKKDKKEGVDEGLGETIQFSGGPGEIHTLWIEKKAGAVTVLVKSSTAAVEKMLVDFETKLAQERDAERKSEGHGLITAARGKLEPTTAAANAESAADDKAKQDGASAAEMQQSQTASETTKRREEELADALAAVFEFFGLDSGITRLIGKPLPTTQDPPKGYAYRSDGPYTEIGRAAGEKGNYPEVHVDLAGLVQYGPPGLSRYDRDLIARWDKAKSHASTRFNSDFAPELSQVQTRIIAVLSRPNLAPELRWGIRRGLESLVSEIETGSPVEGAEIEIGRKRIDYIIRMIEGVDLSILVEYKHWTRPPSEQRLFELADKLHNQVDEFLHFARKGGNNYAALILKWKGFSTIGPRAQEIFSQTLTELVRNGAQYNVTVVLELE
jgi:hypothetical protein